jgi:LacI family transcriptional regulator
MTETTPDRNSPLPAPVTIDDIARRAQVHPSTVSRTMAADPEKLTPRRRKILEMAREMGYTPNSNAAALRRGASDTIGMLVVSSYLEHPTQSQLSTASYAMRASAETGLRLITDFFNWGTSWQPGDDGPIPQIVRERRVGGIIVLGTWCQPQFDQILSWKIPACAIGQLDNVPQALCTVGLNVQSGMTEAVQYLAALGHRKIALVIGGAKHVAHVHQQQAFERTASEFGLPIGDDWLIRADIDFPRTAKPLAEGERLTAELLKRPIAKHPTAIIYGNDAMAIGGLQAAAKCNISVPNELSIIGTSDSFLASGSEPQLTSIRDDHHSLMSTALRLVDLQIRNVSIPQRHVLIDSPLIKRQSCAPPAPGPGS